MEPPHSEEAYLWISGTGYRQQGGAMLLLCLACDLLGGLCLATADKRILTGGSLATSKALLLQILQIHRTGSQAGSTKGRVQPPRTPLLLIISYFASTDCTHNRASTEQQHWWEQVLLQVNWTKTIWGFKDQHDHFELRPTGSWCRYFTTSENSFKLKSRSNISLLENYGLIGVYWVIFICISSLPFVLLWYPHSVACAATWTKGKRHAHFTL